MPNVFEVFSESKKKEFPRSKQLMTSLGGFERAADIVEQSANGTLKVKPTPKLVNWCFDMHVLLLTIGLILSTVFALVIWSFFRLGKSVGLYFVGEREKTDWFSNWRQFTGKKVLNLNDTKRDWTLFSATLICSFFWGVEKSCCLNFSDPYLLITIYSSDSRKAT